MPNKNNIKILNYFVNFFNESFQFDIYVKWSFRSFCLQGDPGPRGETGHAGPQGEKVRLRYFLLFITCRI